MDELAIALLFFFLGVFAGSYIKYIESKYEIEYLTLLNNRYLYLIDKGWKLESKVHEVYDSYPAYWSHPYTTKLLTTEQAVKAEKLFQEISDKGVPEKIVSEIRCKVFSEQ
ncbi:MAG TPA: hypothetical protein PLP33_25205 [Leptospiraceae bacterium]|nr:hypothetical protein [Leptospiraceae bacterium]